MTVAGVTATFAYNGLGQRVEKNPTTSYDKRFFYGQNGELLIETDDQRLPAGGVLLPQR